MKHLVLSIAILFSASLMLIASIRHSSAEYQAQAQRYISQGLYDEGMQAYYLSELHLGLLKNTIHYLGKFNAVLAILGMLFLLSGLFLKKLYPEKKIRQIYITQDFNWHQNIF